MMMAKVKEFDSDPMAVDFVGGLMKSVYELINLVQDTTEFYEPYIKQLNQKVADYRHLSHTLKRKNQSLEDHHRHLIK
jgi:hypothetical protein